MKCKEKLFITLLVFLLSLTSVYAGGIELGAYLGQTNGVELGYTFGASNNWVIGAMLGSHDVEKTYYNYSSSPYYTTIETKNTLAGGGGIYLCYNIPILFLHLGVLEMGIEPAMKLFVTYNSYKLYTSSSSSPDGFESYHNSAPDVGLSYNLNLIGRISRFDLTLGYKGEFHILESIIGLNESLYKSAFTFSFRYHFSSGRGRSAATSITGSEEYDAVRILPIPGTNIPSYQRIAE